MLGYSVSPAIGCVYYSEWIGSRKLLWVYRKFACTRATLSLALSVLTMTCSLKLLSSLEDLKLAQELEDLMF